MTAALRSFGVFRVIVLSVVFLAVASLILFAASLVMTTHQRSGGCNHIPLTANGQPAYACADRPPQ